MKTEQPSEWAMQTAAQLWTLPQHSSKVMDSEFAMSIARALDKAVAFARAPNYESAMTGHGVQHSSELEASIVDPERFTIHQRTTP